MRTVIPARKKPSNSMAVLKMVKRKSAFVSTRSALISMLQVRTTARHPTTTIITTTITIKAVAARTRARKSVIASATSAPWR